LKFKNYWINGDCVSSLKDRCSNANESSPTTYIEETETAGSNCLCNERDKIFNFDSDDGSCLSCGNKVKVLNRATDEYECQTNLQVACDKLTNAKYDKTSDKCICTNKAHEYTDGICKPKAAPAKPAPAPVTGLQKACITTKLNNVAAKWIKGKCVCPGTGKVYTEPTNKSGNTPGKCV
jgi:hypothetical protein